eukprot:350573-Pyramimonas_sp.AAC.1
MGNVATMDECVPKRRAEISSTHSRSRRPPTDPLAPARGWCKWARAREVAWPHPANVPPLARIPGWTAPSNDKCRTPK